jgi:hypothetical protein
LRDIRSRVWARQLHEQLVPHLQSDEVPNCASDATPYCSANCPTSFSSSNIAAVNLVAFKSPILGPDINPIFRADIFAIWASHPCANGIPCSWTFTEAQRVPLTNTPSVSTSLSVADIGAIHLPNRSQYSQLFTHFRADADTKADNFTNSCAICDADSAFDPNDLKTLTNATIRSDCAAFIVADRVSNDHVAADLCSELRAITKPNSVTVACPVASSIRGSILSAKFISICLPLSVAFIPAYSKAI